MKLLYSVPPLIVVLFPAEQGPYPMSSVSYKNIIGRENEIQRLTEALSSRQAEFIAVYGRRRIGKTYLIKQFFEQQGVVFFEQTGIHEGSMRQQLKLFSENLAKTFYQNAQMALQKSWMDALQQLASAINSQPKDKTIVLFFDELPWLATHKSGFLTALEYFWNTVWSYRQKLILIVCGSAASWMIRKILYDRGGLHNRITITLPLKPFNLKEARAYLRYLGIPLTLQQTLQIYMVTGGVPHYLKAIRKGLSAAQNINALCFQKEGLLLTEFEKLFHSLYEDADIYIQIIRAIAKKSEGISRDALISSVKQLSDGGRLNTKLKSLEEAGFISNFLPLGHLRRGAHYKVTDEYTLFYLSWIEPFKIKSRQISTTGRYWELMLKKPAWYAWAGHAFEAICYKHIESIQAALKLETISFVWGDWRTLSVQKKEKTGVQIDLLFDREDGCTTLCEIKYTDKPFVLSKDYANELERKQRLYRTHQKTQKQLFWVIISANGIQENENSRNLITQVVSLEHLFA